MMDSIRPINKIRRFITSGLTRHIGKSEEFRNIRLSDRTEVKRILIVRPNHRLGNQLMITPLIQEVTYVFPDCKIDLFVKGGVASVVVKNYTNIDNIIKLPKEPFREFIQYASGWQRLRKQSYDIVINAARSSSSGRIATKHAHSRIKLYGNDENEFKDKYPDYAHVAKYPVYSLRNSLSKMGIDCLRQEMPSVDLKLSDSELADGKKILESLISRPGRTISLFTYATGPKCYNETWWSEFYSRLCREYPDINIIEILPVENISLISFKAPSFYSKDIREIGSVIANTDVFIGADSGIMHLASSSKTPTLGLFSFTDPEHYEPYNNGSKGLETENLSLDDIVKEVDKILGIIR
jgi:ADP-heptose:LPS heptosyltransferase